MPTAPAIDEVFRVERARVLATVIRVCNGDFELAEEVTQDAFTAALTAWSSTGIPAEPRAWLVSVARNKAVDAIRRRIKLRAIVAAHDPVESSIHLSTDAVTDDRLRLIFTCCHPALAPEAQVALTLRTLGGLTTDEIARAFLTSPVTMAQRLVRAKTKIRDARIPYVVPEARELPERLDTVMTVVYLIFNEGYSASAGDEWIRRDLCSEAIRLGRLLVELMPDDREALGLLALMLLHDARRAARTDARGDIILLEDQDRSLWNRAQIDEALALVPRALRGGAGPYALQAAIAALHAQAPRAVDTDWPQIAALYGELERRQPTPVVALNRAAAIAMAEGPRAGLARMAPLADELAEYALFHAARADLLRRAGDHRAAATAYRKALALTTSEPERRYLERRLAELGSGRN